MAHSKEKPINPLSREFLPPIQCDSDSIQTSIAFVGPRPLLQAASLHVLHLGSHAKNKITGRIVHFLLVMPRFGSGPEIPAIWHGAGAYHFCQKPSTKDGIIISSVGVQNRGLCTLAPNYVYPVLLYTWKGHIDSFHLLQSGLK